MTGSKIAVTVLSVILTGTLLAGCGGTGDTTEKSEYQLVPVQRGDLSVEVTSTGNLMYAYEEVLSFGVPGTIEEVLVEEGDEVEEGQLLTRLDSASTVALEKAVAQARINMRIAEDDLEDILNPSAEVDAVDVAQAELAVVNAGIALVTAQDNLEQALDPYTESDIVQAELTIINAELALEAAQDAFEIAESRHQSSPSVAQWAMDYERKQKQLALAEFDLTEAEENLAEMQAGADASEVEQKQKLLAVAEASIARAEETLAEIQDDALLPEPDSLAVELQQIEVTSAQAALDEAIERLEMDTIVAPFAGIVTSVSMEAGRAVSANAVIVLADSTKFEATMLVNEIDIMNVQVGALASVEIGSLSGYTFPAKVTSISPKATPQQGVVNYSVKAELMSLALARGEEAPEEEGEPVSSVDEVLDKAVADGRLTQEQADTMKERFGQAGAGITVEQLEQLIERFAQFDIGAAQGKAGQGEGLTGELLDKLRGSLKQGFGAGPLPDVSPEDIRLRQGLSVTISIIIQQRSNVLLVPNQAITLLDGATYVEVIQDDEIYKSPVETGLSDWQYTEIVQGLNEGEEVVIWQTTGSSAITETEQQKRDFQLIPGAGRFTK